MSKFMGDRIENSALRTYSGTVKSEKANSIIHL